MPTASRADVLIVGAGHAGAHVAIGLSNGKFAGSIVLVGDEPHLPYQRPPLSKGYLAGAEPFERMLIRPAQFWQERGVKVIAAERIEAVDAIGKTVRTASGADIGYGALVWAAGGRPRPLACAGAELRRVHTVRSRSDVDQIVAELPRANRIVVIGGGYIGLEAAAVLSKLGKRVSVVEAMPRLLARVCGVAMSRFYEAEHRAHGVDVRTSTVVECIEESAGAAVGVRIAGGQVLEADLVIVGIGITLAVEPLAAAGAVCSNGVEVDALCRTSLPDVYAVGDCAAHVNAFADGARIRLESVHNAHEMAASVAKTLCGTPTPYHSLPWFWSDQYDLKLQTVGVSFGHDAEVLRGHPESRSFSVVYLKGGRVIALDCVNNARDYVQGRKLVTERALVHPARLADASIQLKELG